MPRKRILVLDDEAGTTRLLKLNLERTGRFDVHVENQGRRALEAAQRFRPDLILLDLIMPDMRAEEILNAIRAEDELRDVPVLLWSAGPRDQLVSREVDGLPCVRKPLRTAELIEHIERHLV